MQSNTTRAANAHSAGALRGRDGQSAPPQGTMKTYSAWKGCAAAWNALTVAVAAIFAANVAAQQNLSYQPPAAHVVVSSGGAGLAAVYDFDGLIDGELQTLEPRIAIASQGAASAYAESSKNRYAVKAIMTPTQNGQAGARARHSHLGHANWRGYRCGACRGGSRPRAIFCQPGCHDRVPESCRQSEPAAAHGRPHAAGTRGHGA